MNRFINTKNLLTRLGLFVKKNETGCLNNLSHSYSYFITGKK